MDDEWLEGGRAADPARGSRGAGEPAVTVVGSGRGHPLALVEGPGAAEALVWPGMGAEHRSLHRIRLDPGARTVEQRHGGEAVYYLVEGAAAVVDAGTGEREELTPGHMVHIVAGTRYRLEAVAPGTVLAGGPCPPDEQIYGGLPAGAGDGVGDGGAGAPAGARAATSGGGPPAGFRVFSRDEPSLCAEMISSDARFVVWPGVGARVANMNYVRMVPGERNRPHAHAGSEDTILILSGRGTVDDLTNGTRHAFEAGDVIHVAAGVRHAVCADRGAPIESVGGPCPPDWAMLRALGYEPEG